MGLCSLSGCSILTRGLLLLVFMESAAAVALQNITLALPAGTSDHGTPGLLCTPTKWTDLASFYLLNYVAHAATVIARPGERTVDFAATVIGSLLFPAMGLYHGIEAILSGAIFYGGRDDLRKAARSGALCMLVRSKKWRPVNGEEVQNVFMKRQHTKSPETGNGVGSEVEKDGRVHVVVYQPPWILSKFGCPVYVHRQIIHGTYSLPEGYLFVIVPRDVEFAEPTCRESKIEVAATYNIVKALVALAQTGYASLTLYRSRGDQIKQFGYAAFGLTVAPYAVMSIMNLLGNLCRPDYASLYMVESSSMDEARRRGGIFEGTVGRAQEERSPSVCSCTFADGEDVEDLRFSSVDGEGLVASFGTTAPSTYTHCSDEQVQNSSAEESSTDCSSALENMVRIRDQPSKRDYTSTKKDALLLVPSCNPLRRSSSRLNIEEGDSPRHKVANVALEKTWRYSKKLNWTVAFEPRTHHTSRPLLYRSLKYLLTLFISLLPLLITGLMSRFQPGIIPNSDSTTWKVYTMQWLSISVLCGLWLVFDQEVKDASEQRQKWFGPVARVTSYVTSAWSAIGGFIVVGQMLWRYGVCVHIT